MDCFLKHKQFAKEAEVDEQHIEKNFEIYVPTTKRNNVKVSKFNEKWKEGCP